MSNRASCFLPLLHTYTEVSAYNCAFRATSILVTHFLLDLQQASRRTTYLPATNTENWEKVMGSLVLVELELEEDCDALVRHVRTP